jgi:hypothetical protein
MLVNVRDILFGPDDDIEHFNGKKPVADFLVKE